MKKKAKLITSVKPGKTKIGKTAWLLEREAQDRNNKNKKDLCDTKLS